MRSNATLGGVAPLDDQADVAALWAVPPDWVDVGGARIAYRKVGQGPPLLFLHGWPLSSFSFRKLIAHFSPDFTCYLPDTPGLGETQWSETTDFMFRGQALTLRAFVEHLGLERCAVLAFDTGATIARELSLQDPQRITALVLLNTEIPQHRPPFIQLFQQIMKLPGSSAVFRRLLRSPAFCRSRMAFGGSFVDLTHIDGDFRAHFIEPLIVSPHRLEGAKRYLWGIDWTLVDSLASRHASITAPVLLISGADDPTFPVALARPMAAQLPTCRGLVEIPSARLLVHEEQPVAVARAALDFLRSFRGHEWHHA